jgi:circadian clock protein KaiB
MNLTSILSGIEKDDYALEIVDCVNDPHRALADGVLVTPTLIKESPDPAQTIVGSLSDRVAVVAALGLTPSNETSTQPKPHAPKHNDE